MTLFVVLILIALAAYHFWPQISALLSRVQKAKDPAPEATPQSPQAPVAPQTVILPGTNQPVSSVTDAWLRSGAGYGKPTDNSSPAENNAPVDTSTVDSAVGQNIILTGNASKEIQGAGAVAVTFNVRPDTKIPYKATVNGVTKQADTEATLRFDTQAPLSISVEQEGAVVMHVLRI